MKPSTSVTAPSPSAPSAQDLRNRVLEIRDVLRTEGFDRIAAVELTAPGAALVVVRVVVPGCSDASRDNVRLGRRVRLVGDEPSPALSS